MTTRDDDQDDDARPTLRPGDEVEVTFPCVIADLGWVRPKNWDQRFDPHWLHRMGARIVVTMPFDHPSRDLVGTVRGDADNAWVKVAKYGDDAVGGNDGIWWNVLSGEERVGDEVEEWPVTGSMPSTPAWQRDEEARRGRGDSS